MGSPAVLCAVAFALAAAPAAAAAAAVQCSVCRCDGSLMDCASLHIVTLGTSPIPSSVTRVNISHNQLQRLAGEPFLQLPSLQALDASDNRLTSLPPEALLGCGRLRWLSLADNSLQALQPGSLAGLTSLRRLDLSRNLLANLPYASAFLHTPELRSLGLSGNRLSALLPAQFVHLHQLVELDLSGNRLTSLKLDSLPRIRMSAVHNEIRDGANGYAVPLEGLKLDISYNNITHVDKAVLPYVRVLNVSHNDIRTLESGFVCDAVRLKVEVRLENNPHKCYCEEVEWCGLKKEAFKDICPWHLCAGSAEHSGRGVSADDRGKESWYRLIMRTHSEIFSVLIGFFVWGLFVFLCALSFTRLYRRNRAQQPVALS